MSKKLRHPYLSLKLSQLIAHPKVQRGIRQAHVARIAAKFDPAKLGVIHVVLANGSAPTAPLPMYHVIDGQHRVEAARLYLKDDNQEIDCCLHSLPDADRLIQDREAADLQLGIDEHLNWRAADKFPLRLMSGDWAAITIRATLHQFGLRIGGVAEEGVVRAIAACDWIIHKAGGQAGLEAAVRVLHHAWGKEPDAYHNTLLRGVALLHNRYGDLVDDTRLSVRLAKSGGPGRFLGRARDLAKASGVPVPKGAAQVMANEYNKGRRTKQLPAW